MVQGEVPLKMTSWASCSWSDCFHLPNDASAALNESIDLDDGTRGYVLVSDQTGLGSGMEGFEFPGGNLTRVVGADDFLTREIRVPVEGLDDEMRDLLTISYHGYNEPHEIERLRSM